MISADVQRVKLEARERSLEDYRLKCQDLRKENTELKDESDKQEHDSQLVLKFLRDDAERKDELIESLKKTINQQRELFAAQREDERRVGRGGFRVRKVGVRECTGNVRRSQGNFSRRLHASWVAYPTT